MVKNYGLILRPAEPDHWEMGSGKATARFGAAELNPSGDWSAYDPARELQRKNGLETNNCTNFGTCNALLALARFLGFDDFVEDSSERYTGVMTGTSKTGNDPHHVIEEIRTECGLIEEKLLPWTNEDTWDEYYAPNPMYERFVAIGQSLLKRYVIGHEWVIKPGSTATPAEKKAALQTALKRGTVAVSVRAWEKAGSVYVKQPGTADTHWVWLMKYDKNGYPIIRDQYDPFEKKLDKEYDFGCAKLYFIQKNESGVTPVQADYLSRVLAWAAEVLKKVLVAVTNGTLPAQQPKLPDATFTYETVPAAPAPAESSRGRLYEEALQWIGKDASPRNLAPQELSCAEGVSNIIHSAFPSFAGSIVSTAELYQALRKSPLFKGTLDLLPGNVIVSPTGKGNGRIPHGHAGIILEDGKIASNDSASGLFKQNYTIATWVARYRTGGGYPLYVFEPV